MIQFTEDEVEMRVLFLIKFRSYSYPILLDEVIRFLIVISALSCVRIKIIQIDKIYRDYNLDSYRYRFCASISNCPYFKFRSMFEK